MRVVLSLVEITHPLVAACQRQNGIDVSVVHLALQGKRQRCVLQKVTDLAKLVGKPLLGNLSVLSLFECFNLRLGKIGDYLVGTPDSVMCVLCNLTLNERFKLCVVNTQVGTLLT